MRAIIIPTGQEILDGIVLDTDSPTVMSCLIGMTPNCEIYKIAPLPDDIHGIRDAVENWVAQNANLIVLIGGSGGGHRHSRTLSPDCTWVAILDVVDRKACREIRGKNGHLWCKLICGKKGETMIINLPGPFVEAKACIEAFCQVYPAAEGDLGKINQAMTEALLALYPVSSVRDTGCEKETGNKKL